MQRVVITGLGAITPIGLTVEEFWTNLCSGVSGVGSIARFDATGYPARIAAVVKGFDPRNYMDFKLARRTNRPVQFAIAAVKMALQYASLRIDEENSASVGVVLDTGIGGWGKSRK